LVNVCFYNFAFFFSSIQFSPEDLTAIPIWAFRESVYTSLAFSICFVFAEARSLNDSGGEVDGDEI
jgi:hypothetical protein